MNPHRFRTPLRWALLGILLALYSTGCIGIYKNHSLFEIKPTEHTTTELEIVERYGAPDFVAEVGQDRIYVYKVRDNKYIILVGLFDGYDLLIHCRNGVVTKVARVERPKAFSLFVPWTWADTQ